MANYLVTWVIDIEADDPKDAALQALNIQRNPESTAVVFEVTDASTDDTVLMDLMEHI